MSYFSLRINRRDHAFAISYGSHNRLVQASKALSLDVVRRMLWFIEEYKESTCAASEILMDLTGRNADRAIVQMQLNKLAAQRLMGG